MRLPLARTSVIAVTALAVFLPLGLIFYQSLLDAPFFMPHKLGVGAFEFIFADSDFWDSLENSLIIATAMVVIAVPLGGILAFLMVRTDLPGRTWIEPLLLIPVFVSPMVLAFGYVVAAVCGAPTSGLSSAGHSPRPTSNRLAVACANGSSQTWLESRANETASSA